jgi:hypothetical protein
MEPVVRFGSGIQTDKPEANNTTRENSSARGGGGSLLVILSHSETRHQPGPARRAPVARERRIGGWEAAALARRLLVLNSGRGEVRGCRSGSVSNVDAGLERGRGRGALDPKGHGTVRGLLTYPFKQN